VIMAMYMKPSSHEQAHAGVLVTRLAGVTLAVMVAALLVFGVWPNPVLAAARAGSHAFLPAQVTTISAPVPVGN
jgi:NADH:ubiquinone oxidoreductase subunit 2 (subunit N)